VGAVDHRNPSMVRRVGHPLNHHSAGMQSEPDPHGRPAAGGPPLKSTLQRGVNSAAVGGSELVTRQGAGFCHIDIADET
jgi:hypothetical protein